MPHAARVADLLNAQFNVDSEFVKGDGGIFEVRSGDQIIWTNRENRGEKPTNEEITAAYQKFSSK